MRSLTSVLLSFGLLFLMGCGGSNSASSAPPVLQSIQVTPASPSVAIDLTQQFKATGIYSSGPSQDLTASVIWSSSNTTIATIGASGLTTSVAPGMTTITAKSGAITGTATLTVPVPVLVSIAISPVMASIAQNTSTFFTANGTYDDGSTKDVTATVTWNSSDTTIATISNTTPTQGTVQALKKAGSTSITAASGALTSNAATLTVTSATLSSIAVTPDMMTIPLGVQQQFTATGTFSDGTSQDITNTVTWSSSGNTIASITVSGLATGLKLGSVTITALSGSINGTTQLTVNAANLASLAVTPDLPSIAISTSQRFTAIGTFNDGSTHNLTNQVSWLSSDTTVATIGSGNGVAKGLAVGSTTITATIGPKTRTATLTVTNATVSSITVTPSGHTIAPNSKLAMTATAAFSDGSTQVITTDAIWSTDAAAVATVNTVGTALGVGAGTANISATLGGISGSAPLTVSGATLVSLAVTPASTVLAPSSTLVYQAVGTYSDSTTQNISNVVTWSTSAPLVASITSAGQATGQSAGSATITAKLGSISHTASVIVESSALQSIAVTPVASSFPAQVAMQYTATATFADGSTQNLTNSVTWTSSAPSVATVSAASGNSGVVLGVAPGTSTITATFAGVPGSTTLTVTSATLTMITVTPANPDIALGASQQFTATGKFTDGTSFNMTSQVAWSSSNVNVAAITAGGLASSAAVGTTTISAALSPAPAGTAVLTVH